ncbi:M48 family metalloprotease [bacterium]|nr:M48 family metalloprotease [bacterium]
MRWSDLIRFRAIAPAMLLVGVALWSAACSGEEFGSLVEASYVAYKASEGELTPEEEARARQLGQAAGSVHQAAQGINLETERSLGGGLAVRTFSQYGKPHPSEELQRYVNLVGRAVARQGGREDLPSSAYYFAVIDNPDPNAFAGPGGYIFVTSGALELMETEAELAGVLAHEVAHVNEKHLLKMYKRQQVLQAGQELAVALEEDMAQYTQAVDFFSTTVFDHGIDKGFEYDADLVGTEITAFTGYDPAGLRDFLKHLRATTTKQGGWFSTHPDTGARIGKLNAMLATELQGVDGVQQRERFQNTMGRTLHSR